MHSDTLGTLDIKEIILETIFVERTKDVCHIGLLRVIELSNESYDRVELHTISTASYTCIKIFFRQCL